MITHKFDKNGYLTVSNNTMSNTIAINGIEMGYSSISVHDEIAKVKQSIDEINKRLLIIEPDIEKLKMYPALKEAYDHYKTIEALLRD